MRLSVCSVDCLHPLLLGCGGKQLGTEKRPSQQHHCCCRTGWKSPLGCGCSGSVYHSLSCIENRSHSLKRVLFISSWWICGYGGIRNLNLVFFPLWWSVTLRMDSAKKIFNKQHTKNVFSFSLSLQLMVAFCPAVCERTKRGRWEVQSWVTKCENASPSIDAEKKHIARVLSCL